MKEAVIFNCSDIVNGNLLETFVVDDGFKTYYAWRIKNVMGNIVDSSDSRNYSYANIRSAHSAGFQMFQTFNNATKGCAK